MKNNFLLRAALLAAGFGLAFASCSDAESDSDSAGVPAFPEHREASIAPGAQYSFDIEPNMDWEAKIPDEAAAYFNFVDNGHTAYTLHGTAGKNTIVVACSELVDFDTEHVCEITMTMAGQTRVIATLTIDSQGRSIRVYTAVLSPDPEESGNLFLQDEESGAYTYNDTPVEAFDMLTKATEYNYMQRIRIAGNFDWSIGQYPEWMILTTTTGAAGNTDLFLLSEAEKYPWEAVEEALVFIDASDVENPVEVAAVQVSMPGCGDRIFTSLAAEEKFNAEGAYYSSLSGSYNTPEVGTTKNFEAAYGCQIALLVENADGTLSVGDAASWIHFASPIEWEEAAKSAGLWLHNVQILCDANTGEAARKAYVVAIPRTKVPDNFDTAALIDGSKVADAYAGFVVSTITQTADAGEFVEFYEDLGPEMAAYYSLTKLPAGDFPYADKWASVPVIYNLTYTTEMAAEMAELKFNVPFDSYEVYDANGPYAESQLEPRWVDLTEGYNGDNCRRIAIACEYDEASGTFVWTYKKPEYPEAYFVFKDGTEIVGIIQFRFDGEGGGSNGGDGEIALAEPIEGVTLAPLMAGDDGFDDEMECPQYKLTITDSSVKQIGLNLPENDESTYFDDEVVYLYPNGANYMLQLFFEASGTTEITLKNNYMIIGRILVVYQPE